LYRWKVVHIQDQVRAAVERSGYLDPVRGNRLIIFSDHGRRKGLVTGTLANPQYWNVLLASFGTPPADASRPVSLLEIPAMLGFPDPSRPELDAPAYEYADIEEKDVPLLGPYFSSDGRIFLSPEALRMIRGRMKTFALDPLSAAGRPDTERT